MTDVSNPPRISIAVPVYNEGDLLRGTLETLRTQTFDAIEVLIFDNASTDHTPDVAAEYVNADPRFRYFRQSENKGVLANFHDSLLAATSPYFLWRAADDRSDQNYLEVLAALLDADPQKKLAVGTVISSNLDGGKEKRFEFPDADGGTGFNRKLQLMYRSHASWIYGLFRRDALVERMNIVMKSYGHPWGFDHLVLFPFLLDEAVVGTRATQFRQVIKRGRADTAGTQKRKQSDLATMVDLRRRFLAQTRADVASRTFGPIERFALDLILRHYVGKRVYKLRKVLRRRLFARG